MLSRFHPIPGRYGRTDGQTELLYQYRASVCLRAIKIHKSVIPYGGIPIQPKSCMVGDVHDIIACVPSFKLKFLWVAILQRVEFSIFLLLFGWALQQCSAVCGS